MNFKKILISIGLSAILIIMMSNAARAQNDETENGNLPLSNKQLFSKLLTEIGIQNPDYNFKLSDIFGGGEKNYGQNLYLAIYQKVVLEPETEAVKMVGQAKGLNSVETRAVLSGSLEPLIQKYPKITQEEAAAWARQMRDIFNDYVDSESLRSETKAIVSPTEIFANNDTSDSGFDLIADLNDIEMILFKEVTAADINIKYSGGYQGEAVPPPQQTEPWSSKPNYPYPQTGSVSGGLAGENTNSGGIGGAGTDGYIDPKDYEPEHASCPANTEFDNAINDYDEKNPPAEPTPSGGGIGAQAGNAGAAGAGAGAADGTGGLFEINPNITAIDKAELKSAESGKWKNSTLCTDNQRFCIEVVPHSSTYNMYYPADPCIACHVEKINESLRKLVSHNLAPRKLTGNLMEMAKCKSGYNFSDFVNINIITVPMPVITPPKLEAIFGRNIFDEFKKFVNKYTLFRQKPTVKISADAKNNLAIDESKDKVVEMIDAWSSSDTTQDEMLKQIQSIISKNKIEAEKKLRDIKMLDTSAVQGEFYQSLLYQLDEMNALFESLKQLLTDTAAKCEVIKNKDYVD